MERGNGTGSSDSFRAIVLLLGGCEGGLVGGGGGDISEGFAGGGGVLFTGSGSVLGGDDL